MTQTDRGLASGMLGFFAIIFITALLFTLFDPAIGMVLETASDQADHSSATNVIDERQTIWENILFFALFMAALFVIAKSVVESRRPG